jgi:predicted Fe-Mo cluster-binding NifX family protein
MRVGIVLADDRGMLGNVCAHFGQSMNFLIIDVAEDNHNIQKIMNIPNTIQHGSGGCLVVDEILKYQITHLIVGGIGMGAKQKFAARGIKIFGFQGTAKDGLDMLLKDSLGDIKPCKEGGANGHNCHEQRGLL